MRARGGRDSRRPRTAAATPRREAADVRRGQACGTGWPQALAAAWAAGVLLLRCGWRGRRWRVSAHVAALDRVDDEPCSTCSARPPPSCASAGCRCCSRATACSAPRSSASSARGCSLPRDLLDAVRPRRAAARLPARAGPPQAPRRAGQLVRHAAHRAALAQPRRVARRLAAAAGARAGVRRAGHVAHDDRRRPPGLRPHDRQAARNVRPRRRRARSRSRCRRGASASWKANNK